MIINFRQFVHDVRRWAAGQALDESLMPLSIRDQRRPGEAGWGIFTHATTKARFEYMPTRQSWAREQGYLSDIFVGGVLGDIGHASQGQSWGLTGRAYARQALIKGTVAYVVIDEDEDGKPVVEKWPIRNHIQYKG